MCVKYVHENVSATPDHRSVQRPSELNGHSRREHTSITSDRVGMIQSKPEGIEQIRERICKMSDAELRKHGRAAQDSPDPKKSSGHGIRPSKFGDLNKLEELPRDTTDRIGPRLEVSCRRLSWSRRAGL